MLHAAIWREGDEEDKGALHGVTFKTPSLGRYTVRRIRTANRAEVERRCGGAILDHDREANTSLSNRIRRARTEARDEQLI